MKYSFGIITKTAARKLAPKGTQWCSLDGTMFFKINENKVFFHVQDNQWAASSMEPDMFSPTYFYQLSK